MTAELALTLEALLFAAGRPVTTAELASATDCRRSDVLAALKELQAELARRGVRLQEHSGEWQMVSAPEAARAVEKLLGLPVAPRLSQAALETLSIVAYRQPVTRAQIEAIRGVDCSGVINSLLSRGLIEELGRSEGPGRPILYGTGLEFLQMFGLETLEGLPPLPEPEEIPEGATAQTGSGPERARSAE